MGYICPNGIDYWDDFVPPVVASQESEFLFLCVCKCYVDFFFHQYCKKVQTLKKLALFYYTAWPKSPRTLYMYFQ